MPEGPAGYDFPSLNRSLQEWLSRVLPGTDWDVQPVRKEPQRRPLAVLRPVPGTLTTSGSAFVRQYVQDFEIFIYPPGYESDPHRSQHEAHELFTLMDRAFNQGHKDAGSFTMRLPLWDWTGIDMDEPLPENQTPIDWLPVSGFGVAAQPDPDQDDLFTVTVDFRLTWHYHGDLRRFDGPAWTQPSNPSFPTP